MSWFIKYKYLIIGAIALIGIYLINLYVYNKGYKAGIAEEKQANLSAIALVKEELNQKEAEFNKKNIEISTRLQEVKDYYENYISNLSGSLTDELRQSQERAKLYQRYSQADRVKQEYLAHYAAELDRCIVEGREVVKELRATIELRDRQIVELSNYIKATRELNGQ